MESEIEGNLSLGSKGRASRRGVEIGRVDTSGVRPGVRPDVRPDVQAARVSSAALKKII